MFSRSSRLGSTTVDVTVYCSPGWDPTSGTTAAVMGSYRTELLPTETESAWNAIGSQSPGGWIIPIDCRTSTLCASGEIVDSSGVRPSTPPAGTVAPLPTSRSSVVHVVPLNWSSDIHRQ